MNGDLEFRQIGGRLADTPSFRQNPDGSKVANFRLITNVNWTNKQTKEPMERAEGFGYELWGDQAETMRNLNLAKGQEMSVKAEPINHKYKDEATGEDRYRIRLRVTWWRLHGRRPESGAPVGGDSTGAPDDDVAF